MDKTHRPKVDIFMLCYNHAEYVGEAIESILNQTYSDFEFFIVENGSTDHSYEVISRYKDPRIRLFRLEKNNCQLALEMMNRNQTGEYIANMCSDDYWEPTKLEKQMQYLEEHKDIKASATWGVFVDENMQPIDNFMKGKFIQSNRSRLDWIRFLLLNGNHLSASSQLAEAGLYKRTISKMCGYWQLCDYYAWLEILQETNIYVVEEVLVKQRIHFKEQNSNISMPDGVAQIRTYTETADIVLRVIEELSDEDFINIFWNELKIQRQDLTHIEVLCEKFFILFSMAQQANYLEQNVLNFFYKYYGYAEEGILLADVLREEYNYGYQTFTEVSGQIGLSKRLMSWEKRECELLAKLRAVMPVEMQEKVGMIVKKLQDCLKSLHDSMVSEEIFYEAVQVLNLITEEWDWLEFVEIPVKKEEIELCKKVCSIYAKNPQIADTEKIYSYIERYTKELEAIIQN